MRQSRDPKTRDTDYREHGAVMVREVEPVDHSSKGRMADGAHDFPIFYERNYPQVLKLAYIMSGSWHVAEEVTQEAFVRALSRWDGQLTNPPAWVRTTAVNLARSRLRRARAEVRALSRVGIGSAAHEPVTVPLAVTRLWDAVRGLPRRQAQALALHYVEDLPVSEVAVVMGCAEGTVKALLHQGRHRLAGQLNLKGTSDE